MDLEREIYVNFVEDVQNRNESARKVVEAFLQEGLAGGRKCVACVPNTRATKAGDHGGKIQVAMRLRVEKAAAGAGGQFQLFGSALVDTLGITIPPDRWGENSLVTLIDEIADRLTNQMVG